ncbi:unnamed protein product [Phaedon cochleariae]|uniref:DUF7869 domain-containing protein n=1 Tax=Phaedon cochleariae TaxID=80249 RepID=A0A9N9SMS2_PHACE|nr:unnamed protein product [Phaedon cochleariae]
MGKRAQIIVDKALRLKEDNQSEPKRLKLNQCNEEPCGSGHPQNTTSKEVDSSGTNIMNTEHKEPENLEFQCQNNEDLLEEIAIPDEDSLEEMVIDNNYNNYELNNIEQEIQNEDSDDSMKDRDYIPDSESVSSLEEGEVDLLFDEEEIERKQKLKQEKENWKGRSKKGRNNKYPGQTFATRKKLKDANKTHYTVKGKLKEAKQFIDYKCSCLKKCSEKLSGDEKGIYFKNFYDLASYDLQTSYIAATVKEMPIKRKRAKNGPGKSYTRVYMLGKVEVCRDTYINTYQISTKRVNTALEKKRSSHIKDERGKSGGKKKVDEEIINLIINHIKKFPTYVSHYSRSETEAKFLPYDLTESKMYELYIADNHPKVSFQFFKNIFYKHFNLKRKPPIKDTCNKCDMYSSQVKNAQDENQQLVLKQQHDVHLERAQLAREQLNKDMREASKNRHIETLCYDMEKVLGLPKLPTNIVYYKRQLSIFNEGIHSGSTNTPYCFLWKEGVAGRGAQEVGSCIKKFIDVHLKKGVEELILWSDSCGGQNRNIKIVIMLKTVLMQHPTLNVVYFKYLESGHSFLPNDTDFGQIERALKNQVRIYTLKDFMSVIGNCKKHHKFVINLMESDDFYSTEDIEKQISNRKLTTNKEKVSWLKTKIIKLEKSKPNSIFLCESHSPEENDFKEIDILKITRGKKIPIDPQKLKVLYPEGKAISKKKWDDIKTLLKFLPKDAIDFYRVENIENFEDDIEGFGSKTDFDYEDAV